METTFSSKQVAEQTGLSVHTLRYYEQMGLVYGIQRDDNGYRQYSESDIKWFQVIKHFRDMGLPIREMQQFSAMNNSAADSARVRREFMETYRARIVEQQQELERALRKVDDKIEFFRNRERIESEKQQTSTVKL
ncbi:MerR family transcriptional regulator [Paenibacillus dauci]|uniref:MerR family transcriptional regulator n=1 Tax=Paenibacillus dauci TaxID=1567106 RepID=UPI000619A119|nr:MerR family transcriptional regulator [Paenibacillus dauci]